MALCDKDPYYIKLFFLTDIFNGELKKEMVSEIIGYDEIKIDYIIKETEIFKLINNEILKVTHTCYTDTLKKMSYITESMKQALSRRILDKNILPRYCNDEQIKMRIRINLYEHLNLTTVSGRLCLGFAMKMYRQGMYSLSSKYAFKAKDMADGQIFDNRCFKIRKILTLSLLLQNEIHSQTLEDGEIDRIIQDLSDLFNEKEIKDYKSYYMQYFHFLLLKNQIDHYRGNYAKTYENMKEAIQFMESEKEHLSSDIMGKCWLEYAISVKENYSIDPCLKIFRQARKNCPQNNELLFSNLTHISEKYSTYAPQIAIKSLFLIEQMQDTLSKASIFHNQTNIGFMKVYMKDYCEAWDIAEKNRKSIEEFGIKNEESRCCNLLGCLHFIGGNYHQAEKFFLYGKNNLDSVHQITTLWPILVNFALLSLKTGNFEQAQELLNDCVKIFVKHYRNRVNNFLFKEPKFPKLFVSILTVYEGLLKIQYFSEDYRLCTGAKSNIALLEETFQTSQFQDYYDALNKKKPLNELLKETPFVHKDLIIIKT